MWKNSAESGKFIYFYFFFCVALGFLLIASNGDNNHLEINLIYKKRFLLLGTTEVYKREKNQLF